MGRVSVSEALISDLEHPAAKDGMAGAIITGSSPLSRVTIRFLFWRRGMSVPAQEKTPLSPKRQRGGGEKAVLIERRPECQGSFNFLWESRPSRQVPAAPVYQNSKFLPNFQANADGQAGQPLPHQRRRQDCWQRSYTFSGLAERHAARSCCGSGQSKACPTPR